MIAPALAFLRRRREFALLAVVLGVGALLRLWIAYHDDGIFWPDEIFQSLEPAHWLTFGYGLLPWEYVDGARSWALPGLVAGLLKLFDLVHPDDPTFYVHALRLVFSAAGVATAWGSWRLARAFGAGPVAAAVGASFFSISLLAVYFSPRAMSETACAMPATIGFALAADPTSGARKRALGASLLGAAVVLRLHAAIFCVALLALLVARRRWRFAFEAGAVLALWAFFDGLLDRVTWGEWFHSTRVYLGFNLFQHGAERFGTAPFFYYADGLWKSCGPALVVFGVLALLSARRAPGLLATGLAFFLLHSWTAHKELRFILPFLPFLGASAGVGLSRLAEAGPLALLRLPAGAAALLSLWPTPLHRGKFGDLGEGFAAANVALGYCGDINRLLLLAHDQPDLCGLKVESQHLAWTGGYSYLHREIPLYYPFGPGRDSHLFNYVITTADHAGGGTVLARDRDQVLVWLGDRCAPDPGYWRDWRKRKPAGVDNPLPYRRTSRSP